MPTLSVTSFIFSFGRFYLLSTIFLSLMHNSVWIIFYPSQFLLVFFFLLVLSIPFSFTSCPVLSSFFYFPFSFLSFFSPGSALYLSFSCTHIGIEIMRVKWKWERNERAWKKGTNGTKSAEESIRGLVVSCTFLLLHFFFAFSAFASSLMIVLFLNVLHTFPIASVVFAWGKHCLFNKMCFFFCIYNCGKGITVNYGWTDRFCLFEPDFLIPRSRGLWLVFCSFKSGVRMP